LFDICSELFLDRWQVVGVRRCSEVVNASVCSEGVKLRQQKPSTLEFLVRVLEKMTSSLKATDEGGRRRESTSAVYGEGGAAGERDLQFDHQLLRIRHRLLHHR
jgi:hypothetical protein